MSTPDRVNTKSLLIIEQPSQLSPPAVSHDHGITDLIFYTESSTV